MNEIPLDVDKLIYDVYINEYDNDILTKFKNYLKSKNFNNKLNASLLFETYLDIINELNKLSINSFDFLNSDNLGFDGEKIKYFDIGFGTRYLIDCNSLNTIEVENENDIFELEGIQNYKHLGNGLSGDAYKFDNKVIKITQDDSEAYNSNIICLRETKNLIYIYKVYKLLVLGIEEKYVIIQDYIDTTPEIKLNLTLAKNDLIYYYKEFIDEFYSNHIKIEEIESINDIVIKNFLLTMIKVGYDDAWHLYKDILIKNDYNNKYDFNDISEISYWVKNSKTNFNPVIEETPEYIIELLKTLQ